jgi:predicted dehydrogenase
MQKKINIGVVGLDNWYHALPYCQALSEMEGVEFIGISDKSHERAKCAAKQYGVKKWSTDHREIIENPTIDAVIITACTSQHAELSELAAINGKHILCDKPIEVSLEKADSIIQAIEKTGVKFMMNFTRRVKPHFVKAKELIQEGKIGQIVCIVETGRFLLPKSEPNSKEPGWYARRSKAGGGGFIDHAVHQFDALRWLLDDEVEQVSGYVSNLIYKEIEVEDYGIATFKFSKGAVATVESTWTVVPPAVSCDRLEIQGIKGSITVDEISHRVALYDEKGGTSYHFQFEYSDIFRSLLENFVATIRNDGSPLASAWDGRAATELILAVYQSDREGRRITLPA